MGEFLLILGFFLFILYIVINEVKKNNDIIAPINDAKDRRDDSHHNERKL